MAVGYYYDHDKKEWAEVFRGEQGPRGPIGPEGPVGPKGPMGDGLIVKDKYSDYSTFIDNHPTGNYGDAYLVDGDLVLWLAEGWYTVGPLAGVKGDKGDKGDTGDRGPEGPRGLKGDKGDTGDRGPEGYPGEQGVEGPEGPRGLKGDQGDQGPEGPEGPQGEKGDPGAVGNDGYNTRTPDDPANEYPEGISIGLHGNTWPSVYDEAVGNPPNVNFVVVTTTRHFSYSNNTTYQILSPYKRTDRPLVKRHWDEDEGVWGSPTVLGPQGPEGPQGPIGPKGDPGPQGEKGPQGEEGPRGPSGGEMATDQEVREGVEDQKAVTPKSLHKFTREYYIYEDFEDLVSKEGASTRDHPPIGSTIYLKNSNVELRKKGFYNRPSSYYLVNAISDIQAKPEGFQMGGVIGSGHLVTMAGAVGDIFFSVFGSIFTDPSAEPIVLEAGKTYPIIEIPRYMRPGINQEDWVAEYYPDSTYSSTIPIDRSKRQIERTGTSDLTTISFKYEGDTDLEVPSLVVYTKRLIRLSNI